MATGDEARVNSNCRGGLRVRFSRNGTEIAWRKIKRNTQFMKFALEVGSTERHLIEFNFNQLCGTLVIQRGRTADFPIHPSF